MVAELAEALKRREPDAYGELLAQYGDMLYRLARGMTREDHDAEDVVQECLVTVYNKIETLQDPEALPGWLRRIAVNAALMRLRSRKREPDPVWWEPELTADGRHARPVRDWVLRPDEALLRHEVLRVLGEAVAQLPDRSRVVYVLAEIEGLSYAETASLLDLSEGAVRVRLHRARLALRRMLAGYFAERRSVGDGMTVGETAW